MKKRIVSTMMAAVMTTGLVLTGCGSKETAVETSKDAAVETSKQEEATQEKVTLKMHLHTNNKFTILNKDGEILPVYQLAAEKTNVILENVANPVAQKSAEEFQLQATEKFPADIYGGASLKDPIFTYALQGAFIPMNDLIEAYAPNIKKYLEENPEIRKALTAPDGNIYMLNYVPDGEAGRAYFLRGDWLKALNLEVPTTFEELEEVLYAFRDGDPNGNGLKDEVPYFNDKYE